MADFRWIDWNVQHLAEHGVTPEEAEYVVRHPVRGYPRKHRRGYLVWGRTPSGRWLQVAFAREEGVTPARFFVFHARPLTAKEKRRVRP